MDALDGHLVASVRSSADLSKLTLPDLLSKINVRLGEAPVWWREGGRGGDRQWRGGEGRGGREEREGGEGRSERGRAGREGREGEGGRGGRSEGREERMRGGGKCTNMYNIILQSVKCQSQVD